MISSQIQAIVGRLSVATAFEYGTANEINAVMCTNKNFPVACMYKITSAPAGFTKSLAINNSFSLMIEFLYQSQFTSANTAADETLVQNALNLANEFMVKLAIYREGSGRFFRVKSNDKGTISPVYNKYDTNCCGVTLRMTVNTMYNQNVPMNG